MHFLIIQVQPDLLASFSDAVIERLCSREAHRGSFSGIEVQRGDDDGVYFNVTFETADPKLLWPALRERMFHLGLQGASIVTCTGSRGWDNYVLLHHFSRDVPNERFDAG